MLALRNSCRTQYTVRGEWFGPCSVVEIIAIHDTRHQDSEPVPSRPLSASDDELADAVLTASRALVAVAARSLAAAPSDVTLPQYRALVVLATRGPQRPSDLAAELDVAASSITRLCDRLVRKKLVKRQVRPSNRREYMIEITDEGRAIVDAVTASRRRDIRRLLRRIPASRRQQLLVMLRELSEAAGEPASPASPLGWTS